MSTDLQPVLDRYQYLNQFAQPGQILFFGSSYLDQFPLYELKEDYRMDQTIFKRSIPGLTIEQAFDCLDTCVYDLMPSKLFISFGDTDIESPAFSLSNFISCYRRLLIQLRTHLPKCSIYLMGLQSQPEDSSLNEALLELSREYQCEFIALTAEKTSKNFTKGSDEPRYAEHFHHIKPYLHSDRMSFSEFWNAAC